MEFGWINIFGAGIVVLMLVPNIVYAIRNPGERNLCENRFMNLSEQVGRYACIVLMWLPLLVWKFAFPGVLPMLLYLFGNGILLTAYWIVFVLYLHKKTAGRAVSLAVLPSCIFLLSGLTLRHWLLAGFAVLFSAAHIYVTCRNQTASRGNV